MADYRGPMDHEGYYAEAFYIEPGKCFRMVINPNPGSQGSPTHCPKPVEFTGIFQDAKGKCHTVWSCTDHVGDVAEWKRVSASITDIRDAPKSAFRGPETR
jgi:hypothetical protein